MLIPQFSIRLLLIVMTVCAGVFAIFGAAVRGSGWAAGVSVAILSMAIFMLVCALLFTLVWIFSVITPRRARRASMLGESPFAAPVQVGPDDKDTPVEAVVLEQSPPSGISPENG